MGAVLFSSLARKMSCSACDVCKNDLNHKSSLDLTNSRILKCSRLWLAAGQRLFGDHKKHTVQGMESYCVRAFAEALEAIPYTLAENAGLNPIEIVTDLRNRHANGEKAAGINVRRNTVSDMLQENVVQPLLVTTSAIDLATECVRMILKVGACSSQSLFPDVSQT